MTLDELFPKQQFPLRARTKVVTPNGEFTVVYEAFYRTPATSIEDQGRGIRIVITSSNGAVVAEAACVMKLDERKEVYEEFYRRNEDSFVLIPEDEAERLLDQYKGILDFATDQIERDAEVKDLQVNWEMF